MTPVVVARGTGPVVLGIPHAGTHVPDGIKARLNERGRALTDTDWHIDRLYDGLLPDATTVRATVHRYVVDANRDPSGESLYPGQNTTALVPATDFEGRAIWDVPPTAADVKARRASCHAPYHETLQAELERVQQLHGVAILYDCHSIRSRIPFLFDGTLPDFNIGTNLGTTCAPTLQDAVLRICENAPGYSTVLNGRFKGGWTTRRYGRPDAGCHAIQMELAQSTYLTDEAPPWSYDAGKADRLRSRLKSILTTLADMASSLGKDQ
ncbi:MAG: N-formylglutamate deformylase [Boseongicola sp. SB0676_bin_33]|nr:N-formylglutamate deformylase [Boseongicola sp. SB0676_bin_33]